jgi:hypothetical protein
MRVSCGVIRPMYICDSGDEVTINYGNHSVSEFLTRYGFVPKGQLRSVTMEIAPWPLPVPREALLRAVGEAALQPPTRTELELLRKVMAHRVYPCDADKLTLFQGGLDAQSNFALRMRHLRAGGELSAYAIDSIWGGERPFSIGNEAAMILHLWATCEATLARFPGVSMDNVGDDIDLLQGGDLASDPLMYQLVRFRLGEKFILASCIDAMRPAAMALLEHGIDAMAL